VTAGEAGLPYDPAWCLAVRSRHLCSRETCAGSVQEEAASAAVSIADNLASSARDEVVDAMEKVLRVPRNKEVLGGAQRVLNKVRKTSPPKGGGK